ncbi:transcriptional regulator, AraC family [Campylobacter avium LMG 24591]|uniref:Transcriptional regulator, AraC family n=1 Tax=Campylobacter avium LMG 24591 TaxID=522484 RepID=A0A222MXV0_9BACT|nr:AraC family transcriptional regulator [Campylobacter avium]ASQ30685.1 transcriptional regulator, AraC family [Campylobacter avium LMG 24591]OYD79781.1 transcriptional regulator, AraC family [Campylobacter avium]
MTLLFPDDLKNVKNIELFKGSHFVFANYIQNSSSFNQAVAVNMNCLVLVKKGFKIVHTKYKDYRLEEGEALFLKADNHIFSNIKVENEAYEAVLLFFDNEILLDFANKHKEKLYLNENFENFEIFALKNSSFLSSILNSFEEYLRHFNKDSLLKHKLEELFLYILLENKVVFTAFLRALMQEFELDLSTIFSYYDKTYLTVADMANSVNMDNASFTRKFKTVFKKAPKQYLDDKRFERAVFLLEYSSKNISEICLECGFSSLSWFIERFKKKFNLTPKQYQKSKNLYFSA